MPTGFSANPKKLVSMNDLSLTYCKAHDCHVMLTVFLPIAIRAIKPEFLKMAITRMCNFFSKISQKTIRRQELSDLHEFMVETQNQLEMCLPPTFFEIMVHLMIHLVHQIEALGPSFLHEMWSYERFIIEDIWELDYGRDIKVALFRCRWIKQHQFNEIRQRVVDL